MDKVAIPFIFPHIEDDTVLTDVKRCFAVCFIDYQNQKIETYSVHNTPEKAVKALKKLIDIQTEKTIKHDEENYQILDSDLWFKVLPGDFIITHKDPDELA